jgi:predicted transcriptional regulator
VKVADAIVEALTAPSKEVEGARPSQEIIAHLTLEDSRVLRIVCERLLESGGSFLTPQEIQPRAAELGLNQEQVFDSLEILEADGLLNNKGAIGKRVTRVRLTLPGFGLYARHFVPEYELLRRQVAQAIVNANLLGSYELAERLGRNEQIIKYLLRELESEGIVTLSRAISPHERVAIIHPQLKRFAQA